MVSFVKKNGQNNKTVFFKMNVETWKKSTILHESFSFFGYQVRFVDKRKLMKKNSYQLAQTKMAAALTAASGSATIIISGNLYHKRSNAFTFASMPSKTYFLAPDSLSLG